LRIFDARLDNLDTFGQPIQFLEPVFGEAHLLNNSVSIGVDSRPVRVSAKVLITVSDGGKLGLLLPCVSCKAYSISRVSPLFSLRFDEQPTCSSETKWVSA
jgi:hypothetical protein